MGCLTDYTLKGIMSDCNPVLSGIKKVFLGYKDKFDITPDKATQTATVEAVSGGKLYGYDVTVDTGSLTSTFTRNDANGIRYYTNTIAMQFTKLEATKHLEIQAMGAEELIAIVYTNDGKYWLVGADSYVTATESNAQTGSSFDDLNGYTISLSARSAYLPFEVTKETVDALVDATV
jgi:hypothetical protein